MLIKNIVFGYENNDLNIFETFNDRGKCTTKAFSLSTENCNSNKKLNICRFFASVLESDEWSIGYDNIVMGEVIGSGAFGNVYKATATELPGFPPQKEVVVAVKTLKSK